jgi:hypothetical protein
VKGGGDPVWSQRGTYRRLYRYYGITEILHIVGKITGSRIVMAVCLEMMEYVVDWSGMIWRPGTLFCFWGHGLNGGHCHKERRRRKN